MKEKHTVRAKFWHRRKFRRISRRVFIAILVAASIFAIYTELKPTKVIAPKPTQTTKTAGSSSKQTVAPFAYGIALGNTITPMSQTQRLETLKKIRSLGFSEVRLNIDWSAVQSKNSQTFDWSSSDAILGAVKASGLHAVVTLDRTPVWARHIECKADLFCPPDDVMLFAKFSAEAVRRYGMGQTNITAWEIWNEPNIVEFWPPRPNSNEYAHLLDSASKAIKEVNPNAIVLVGGLSGDSVDVNGTKYIDPRTYLAQLYATRVRNSFDGIAYHPYTDLMLPTVDNPYNGWHKLDSGSFTLRTVMVANGDASKNIWLTEAGEPTFGKLAQSDITAKTDTGKPDHVSEADEDAIAKSMLQEIASRPWIRSLDWYTYMDGSGSDSGAAYGLLRSDGTPKPVLETLQAAAGQKP